jgi:hypothetical protein
MSGKGLFIPGIVFICYYNEVCCHKFKENDSRKAVNEIVGEYKFMAAVLSVALAFMLASENFFSN